MSIKLTSAKMETVARLYSMPWTL